MEDPPGGKMMKRENIKILIMRAPGTNCDLETFRAFKELGTQPKIIHTQRVFKEKNLEEYDILVFPGGFSYGDYVRSGAIWATECEYRIGNELVKFIDEGKPVIGICNGFQQLVELGFLPGWDGKSKYPEAALANSINGYQNRWIRIKFTGRGKCAMMSTLEQGYILQCPVAHGEGRFLLPPDKKEEQLEKIKEKDMLVWQYVNEKGELADENFPDNPNGSYADIAGICNPEGTVLGLMPHPERAFYGYLMPEWTKKGTPKKYGDGFPFFDSIVNHVERKF
jgi:phosphoribosylformylglycinamidine synthase